MVDFVQRFQFKLIHSVATKTGMMRRDGDEELELWFGS